MRKMNGLICLLGVLMLGSCANDVCRVEGKMSDLPGEMTVYMLRRTGEFTHDTVMKTPMKDGRFSLEIAPELFGEQYGLKFGEMRSMATFFAERGKIQIEGNGKMIYNAEAKGTPENELWIHYQQFMDKITKERNSRMREITAGNESDSVKRAKSSQFFAQLEGETKRFKDSLATANDASVVALYLYYQLLPLLKYNEIDEILAKFPTLADNRYYGEMKERADILRRISPGVIAPDFEVKTTDGGTVKLSSFRGKYLILDFWASWCAPCREETVYIKELYNKFHDAGLEVFSVSLDDKKSAWLKAIEEDGMNWNHGCQLMKGAKFTPVAQLYGIDGIPAIWVIDPNGKILAQGLKGEELVAFCTGLFWNK